MIVTNHLAKTVVANATAKKTETKKEDELSVLKTALKKYKNAGSLKLDVKKGIKSEFQSSDVVYAGVISMQKDKLRWDTETPEKSLVLIDGENVWVVSYPPADFKAPVQVTKSKMEKSSEDRLLLNALLGSKNLFDYYQPKKESQKENISIFSLEPKNKKSSASVQKLKISIDSEKSLLTHVEYEDELGNKTQLDFSNLKINPKFKKEHFKFVPPKDAQVTEI